jgi:hypothetical protein
VTNNLGEYMTNIDDDNEDNDDNDDETSDKED